MGKLIENMLKAIPASGYRTYLVSALALMTLEGLRGIFSRAAVTNLEQKIENDNTSLVRGDTK